MPLPGTCQVCNKISRVLMICVYCGQRVCLDCLNPKTGACKECQDSSKKQFLP